jgi:hypothetical protein
MQKVGFHIEYTVRTLQEPYKSLTRALQELYKNFTRTLKELYKSVTKILECLSLAFTLNIM